jgi:uncharacterized protein (TIGR00297 family)
MIDWVNLGVVLALCATLSFLSHRLGLLTASGSASAFLVGILIGVLGSVSWLLILVAFTILGFLVTRYKLQIKMSRGLQEGRKGERTYRNVLANGLVPALVAIIAWAMGAQGEMISGVVYLSAISVAASDTMASEMGILSPRTWLITTFDRVPPGTNGGISAYGTGWSIIGAIGATLLGWAFLFPEDLMNLKILVPIFVGVLGCNVDSLLGATLERRGYIGKLGTNFFSMAVGSLIALGLLLL